MFVINYPSDNTPPAFNVSVVNIKICVSRICPGIIEESNDKYITLPVIEVKDEELEDYKKRYTDIHTTWVQLKVFKSLTETLVLPTRVLKNISPLTKEKKYYPTNLTKWNPVLNERELNRIATQQRQITQSKYNSSEFDIIGAMDL